MQQLCCLPYAITLEEHFRPTYLSNVAVLLEGTNLIGTTCGVVSLNFNKIINEIP